MREPIRKQRYRRRKLVYALSLLIWIFAMPHAAPAADDVLATYVREAVAANPSMQAALDRVRAFDQMIPQAGALPDPMLGVGVANLPTGSFAFDEEPMTGKWISLGQTFPFPGVRGFKRQIAERQRDQQTGNADRLRWHLTQQVKETYYRWAYLQASIRVVEQNKQLMGQFADVATAAYKVGRGAQHDVLRARTEWVSFDDRLLTLRQALASTQARMNTLLNRAVNAPLEAPQPLEFTPQDLNRDTLSVWMLASNPELQSLRAGVEAATLDERLAKRLYFPTISVGAKYSQRDDAPSGLKRDDFFSFELQTSLPLYQRGKQSRLIKQKQVESSRVKSDYSNRSNELAYQLADQLTRHESLAAQIEVYRKAMLPQGRQTVDAALADYQVGRADFLSLMTSQMAVYNYELAVLSRIFEYRANLSRIETTVARELFTGE